MSFLVRQIAQKASGGEIVRAKRVDGDEMVIGREEGSGVHLADLAVHPRHAMVTQLDETHVTIESIDGQPFVVDGRPGTHAELDVTHGSELEFGSHRIKLGQDPRSRFPTFTVRRVAPLSDSTSDKDYSDVYSLKGLVPGKRMSAWAFAALMLVAFLAWPIYSYATYSDLSLKKNAMRPAGYHADKSWESGHLSLAHKNLENDCQACHVKPFVAVRDNACLTCHKDDAHDHIADKGRLVQARGAPTGFAAFTHAVALTFNRPDGRCVDCHTEHTGAGPMAVTQQKFCTNCHGGLKERLPDTKLADAADFGTSHPQLTPMVIVDASREKPLLKQITWTPNAKEFNGLKFTHAQHLSTTNGIAQMVQRRQDEFRGQQGLECKNCHQSDPSGTWFKPVVMEEACQTCHSLTFDQVGGTFRTLRHGEPEMVVADLRAFFRSGAPPRPIQLEGMRRRPGDLPTENSAADYARAVRFYPTRADQAVNMLFNKGGACYDCHVITRAGGAATAGYQIQNVAQTQRYYHKGWFTHSDHTKFDCAECHVKAKTSNDATDLMVPGLDGQGGCRTCHVGEGGAKLASSHVTKPVESSCAMCHDYHLGKGAPWTARLPASRRASFDRKRAQQPTTISMR